MNIHHKHKTGLSMVTDQLSKKETTPFLTNLTTTDRGEALRKRGVGAAAFLIRDAVLGQEIDNPADGAYDMYSNSEEHKIRNAVAAVCSRVCSFRPFVKLQYVVALTLILLTFLEPPHWCRNRRGGMVDSDDCRAFFSSHGPPITVDNSTTIDMTIAELVQYYPNAKSMHITAQQSRWIDGICVGFLTVYTLVRLGRDGMSWSIYLRKGPSQLNRVLQLICTSLMMVGLISNVTQYHPYTRLVWVVTLLPSAQQNIRVVMKMIPETLNVLMLLVVFMVFYAWFGTVMFVETPEGKQHFSSLVESLWSLYIMTTTANYPDVMMPAYNGNRWVAVYFVSFMIISYFFFLNVVLASIVNEYDSALQSQRKSRIDQTNDDLKKAYKIMVEASNSNSSSNTNTSDHLDRKTVMSLFVILKQDFPEFQTLSDDETKIMFAILDQDGSSTISEDEFMNFANVLLLEFIKTSEYHSIVERYFPRTFQSAGYQRFCRIIRSSLFDSSIDIILVLNAIVVGIQSYPELAGEEVDLDEKYWDGSIDTVWEVMETVFTFVYVLECLLKILVFGTRAYMERAKNVFDLIITVLAVICTALVYLTNEINDSRLIRMVVTARVLRLVRILTAMKRFQLVGAVSAEILPKVTGVLLLLFFLMYLFTAIGVALYGGMITRDPSNPLAYLILGTDFSNNDYWANNFNDLVSGMNVLFNLLVVNNWTECEIGFEAVTRSRWVRLFFLSFHVFGVLLVNNLVIAFIINAFLQQFAIHREKKEGSEEEQVGVEGTLIGDRRAIFDASEITGTKTSLTGGYIARYRRTLGTDLCEGHDHDRLRQLFTPRQTSGSGNANIDL